MDPKKEIKVLIWIIILFAFAFFLPIESVLFSSALTAAFDLLKWYAREHFILCLLPAFFIAGAISVFISQGSIMKYFGANAKKWMSYSVAAVSGTILAVCSCTVLPLFSSIHKRGAGLGPAIAFLYSGPAINILAIILTARILGVEMGIARAIGAILFSVVIGLIMALIYRKEENVKKEEQMKIAVVPEKRPVWQTIFHFLILVLILVFANWGKPASNDNSGVWYNIWAYKWYITGFFGLLLGYSLIKILRIKWQWVFLAIAATILSIVLSSIFIENNKIAPLIPVLTGIIALSIITLRDKNDSENKGWTLSAWDYAKQILPLLAIGILIAGFLLGSSHDNKTIGGVIPNSWISGLVGGNTLFSNFFASIAGAFMYFATLTEVPIVQGLVAAGMGKGPALALLLAGPSLSLPSMLVIRGIIGSQKTIVYVSLVVVMATLTGLIFGSV